MRLRPFALLAVTAQTLHAQAGQLTEPRDCSAGPAFECTEITSSLPGTNTPPWVRAVVLVHTANPSLAPSDVNARRRAMQRRLDAMSQVPRGMMAAGWMPTDGNFAAVLRRAPGAPDTLDILGHLVVLPARDSAVIAFVDDRNGFADPALLGTATLPAAFEASYFDRSQLVGDTIITAFHTMDRAATMRAWLRRAPLRLGRDSLTVATFLGTDPPPEPPRGAFSPPGGFRVANSLATSCAPPFSVACGEVDGRSFDGVREHRWVRAVVIWKRAAATAAPPTAGTAALRLAEVRDSATRLRRVVLGGARGEAWWSAVVTQHFDDHAPDTLFVAGKTYMVPERDSTLIVMVYGFDSDGVPPEVSGSERIVLAGLDPRHWSWQRFTGDSMILVRADPRNTILTDSLRTHPNVDAFLGPRPILAPANANLDTIRIVRITPDTVRRGVAVEMTVELDVVLRSTDSARVAMGLNDAGPTRFRMSADTIMHRGTTRVTLRHTVTPMDWTPQGAPFRMMVNFTPAITRAPRISSTQPTPVPSGVSPPMVVAGAAIAAWATRSVVITVVP